jgi:hypothetical protein
MVYAVGIVANDRKVFKSGRGEMQMGGVSILTRRQGYKIYFKLQSEKNSLSFIHDVKFMVGTRSSMEA